MVVNVTFNNISDISWRSVLLVEETGEPGANHRPATSHWQTLSHNVVSSTPRLSGIQTHNYHTITTTTAPLIIGYLSYTNISCLINRIFILYKHILFDFFKYVSLSFSSWSKLHVQPSFVRNMFPNFPRKKNNRKYWFHGDIISWWYISLTITCSICFSADCSKFENDLLFTLPPDSLVLSYHFCMVLFLK